MDMDLGTLHTVTASVTVLLGVLGPVLSILYAVRVDHRDSWRKPMLVSGTLTFVAVLAAYFSGRRLVAVDPGIVREAGVAPHLDYADRLLVPGAGFFVMVVLCWVLHPRTGVLRTVLPLLLTGFSVVLLVLVVVSGDSGARLLLEEILEEL